MPSWYQAGNERFRGAVFPATGSTFTGPGDIQSGASAWWGLQSYSGAYASPGTNPAIDLNNDGTGAFAGTVNILSTGLLDAATATTLIAGGASSISKWYDQTGNGRHQLQASNGARAQLSLSTGPGGNTPAALFTGGASFYDTAGSATIPQPYACIVRTAAVPPGHAVIFGDDGTDLIYLGFRNNNTANLASGTSELSLAMSANTWVSLQAIGKAGAASLVQVDGSSTTGSTGSLGYTGQIGLSHDFGGSNWGGWYAQGGIWPFDNTSVLTAMNSNAHTNWGF